MLFAINVQYIMWSTPTSSPFPQNPPLPRALDDSGCPLGDTDLFDTGLNDEEDEEEESLEAIRAAVKQKMKKHEVEKKKLFPVGIFDGYFNIQVIYQCEQHFICTWKTSARI